MTAQETSYDDFDPSCERTVASLRIFSDILSPEELASRLGIAPTKTLVKGRQTHLPNGRVRTDQLTGIGLDSEKFVSSKDLRRHVDWILERAAGQPAVFRELWQKGEAWGWISCIWWSAEGHGGPKLRADQLAAIAELDLEVAFGLSYYGEEDE